MFLPISLSSNLKIREHRLFTFSLNELVLAQSITIHNIPAVPVTSAVEVKRVENKDSISFSPNRG